MPIKNRQFRDMINTIHRTKTNEAKTQHRKLKRQAPRKSKSNPVLANCR